MPMQPRVALVTGATSGIGRASASALATRKIRVLVHGRTRAGAEATVAELREHHAGASVEPVWGDLAQLAEVRALAEQVRASPRLDLLVHNAGIERWERAVTAEGVELTFAVNHLAPFLLTRLLAPQLMTTRPARVVFVNSVVHGWGTIHWDDLFATTWYAPEPVYYQSKLAAALVAQEFARRLEPFGVSVLLFAPGLTQTGFTRDFRGIAAWWSRTVGRLFFRRPEAVATELARVALDREFANASGGYISRLKIGLPAPRARVVADQQRMWGRTCEILDLDPDWPNA